MTALSIESLEGFMKPVPKGSINLRDDRLGKSWSVDIEPFLCCTVPVTQSLYAEVAGIDPPPQAARDHPVSSVSWLDAAAFCNRLSEIFSLPVRYVFSHVGDDAIAIPASNGFRLLKEAEWEFACRAGTNGPRYAPLDEIGWYRANSEGSAQPVGTKQPNGWDLYDMIGNVWEWCEDIYDPEVYGTYRIFRGGGWADEERGCLATNRRKSHPTFAIDDLGFRIARSLD